MTPQELRNSILQRAIEGKLVEQRAEEGTGAELLNIIFDEVNSFVKLNNVNKNTKHVKSENNDDDIEIPENWEKVKLGEICFLLNGKKEVNKSYPYLEVKYLRGDIEPKIKTSGRVVSADTNIILMDGENSGEIFKTREIGYLGSTLKILYFPKTINEKFYLYFLLLNKKYLRDNKKGAAIPHLDKEVFFNLNFPLPPLAEQKRIVEKIEELMPLIDDYEKNWQRLEELNKKFPEDMKKSLLQEAIKGKLVEQRAEEGTGEELYKLIQEEKKKLIKEGKIKKQKALDEIKEEEIPFDIPKNWKWVRLGEIVLKLTDGAHHTPKYTSRGVPFVSVKDISSGKIDFSDCKYISKKEHEALFERCNPQRGDLLLTKVGTTGIPVIVDTDEEFSLFVSVALLKLPIELLDIYFLKDLINSPLVQVQAKENTRGVGNKNWVMRDIRNTIIPLPPLAEQKRIVEKLEELLPLCDELIKKEE